MAFHVQTKAEEEKKIMHTGLKLQALMCESIGNAGTIKISLTHYVFIITPVTSIKLMNCVLFLPLFLLSVGGKHIEVELAGL